MDSIKDLSQLCKIASFTKGRWGGAGEGGWTQGQVPSPSGYQLICAGELREVTATRLTPSWAPAGSVVSSTQQIFNAKTRASRSDACVCEHVCVCVCVCTCVGGDGIQHLNTHHVMILYTHCFITSQQICKISITGSILQIANLTHIRSHDE